MEELRRLALESMLKKQKMENEKKKEKNLMNKNNNHEIEEGEIEEGELLETEKKNQQTFDLTSIEIKETNKAIDNINILSNEIQKITSDTEMDLGEDNENLKQIQNSSKFSEKENIIKEHLDQSLSNNMNTG